MALADESAEAAKHGLNQLEIQRKDIMKILSVELEGVNRINSLYSVNSRITIKSSHGPKGMLFAHLMYPLPVSFDPHTAL